MRYQYLKAALRTSQLTKGLFSEKNVLFQNVNWSRGGFILRACSNNSIALNSTIPALTAPEQIQPDSRQTIEWKTLIGTPDPKYPRSQSSCQGCGAQFQCKDPNEPGYISSEEMKPRKKKKDFAGVICVRCVAINKFDHAIHVSVPSERYVSILSQIKLKESIVVLLVDLTDIENSIYDKWFQVIGPKAHIFVVGNKVDLLPRDGRGYLERIAEYLRNACAYRGINQDQIKHVALISAKKKYGVEELISKLFEYWKLGDVYLLGATNVGKSSLFNVLLRSDYCKIQASDLIQRATVSHWPGTTLHLLKFPITRPSPERLWLRIQRVSYTRLVEQQRKRHNKIPKGFVGQTFREEGKAVTDVDLSTYTFDGADIKTMPSFSKAKEARATPFFDDHDEEYRHGKWCYDSPGVVIDSQIVHVLNDLELRRVLAPRPICPRVVVIRPRHTLLVAGIGRVDVLEGPVTLYLSVLCSNSLPIHVMETTAVEEWMHNNQHRLVVPSRKADEQPLARLDGPTFEVEGNGWSICARDIVMSSIGRVSVALGRNLRARLRAQTPGGVGIHLRPPLLERLVLVRGKRMKETPFYRLRK